MIFASYTRKSVYSDTSDSTKNQAKMCREYVDFHFSGKVDNFLIYEDEDSTGSNTNRPDLQKLMKDIQSGLIDYLIVYQLDRLSRDIRDFSNIYAFLVEHDVQFISVVENIDTTTPIGKAMMYVSVVFAQMERETIANRVYDNLVGLSDSGWWVAGNPPMGFRRERIISSDGKKHVTIVPVQEEIAKNIEICDIFLENGFSLQNLETYLRNNGYRTKNGKFYSTNQLHKLLTMPYWVEATPEVYDYYSEKGCIMSRRCPREVWDGTHGVMIYGRTTERNKKHELNAPNKWRVCLGQHKPIMDASKWLKIQNQFTHNIFSKIMRYEIPLLKGILRCSCGRLMSLSRKQRTRGGVSTWYCCPRRVRYGKEVCNMSQIKAEFLDNKAIDIFTQIRHDPKVINSYIQTTPHSNFSTKKKSIEKQMLTCQTKITNLTSALSEDTTAIKYIVKEIERYDKELSKLTHNLTALQAEELYAAEAAENLEKKVQSISNLIDNFDSFTPDERNAIAKDCILKCVWDGDTLFITF